MLTDAVLILFQQGRRMLKAWRGVTMELYPNQQDLLEQILPANQLTITKLAKGGWLMTDTCSAARRLQRLLKEAITKISLECGMTAIEIVIYEAGKRFLLLS